MRGLLCNLLSSAVTLLNAILMGIGFGLGIELFKCLTQ